jgi:hypothetical protein
MFCANVRVKDLLTGMALIFGAAAVSLPTPADAGGGSRKDPDTGLICMTPQCDVVRTVDGTNVMCVKVWPDNDRRKKPQLRCNR